MCCFVRVFSASVKCGLCSALVCAATLAAAAQQSRTTEPKFSSGDSAGTHLTIYNDNFAVARVTLPLDLHPGSNSVTTTDVTSQLEPDSVILRDPTGRHTVRVVEQNYDAGIVTQEWLLQKYEGKSLEFQIMGPHEETGPNGETHLLPAQTVQAKVIRASGAPYGGSSLIEVNGHLQFQLPGIPLFPASTDGLLLHPTLRWIIDAPAAERFSAELDYITQGMSWQATYNVVVPEAASAGGAELADVLGWVTIQNRSGKDFTDASVQLMAGSVAKLRAAAAPRAMDEMYATAQAVRVQQDVTQKAFDDFHLYDLHRTLALADRETKQVQFLEAGGVTVQRTYELDSSQPRVQPIYPGFHNEDRMWGATAKPRVDIRDEIRNTQANHLGMPLPAGRLRLYRREAGGAMHFVGEGTIDHTPEGQSLHVVSGQSFDLTGERKQTAFHVDGRTRMMDETFAIKVSNAKPQAVTVHVIERMNRAENWDITEKSADYTRQDSSTVDFPISVPAQGDTTLTYTVHYSW